MTTLDLKKGDTVGVLSGKDKGKTGKIIEVNPKAGRVVVEGLNIHYRFEKKGRANKTGGQRLAFPAQMDVSKVILICPNCGKATRVGHTFLENGTKQRICKKCKKAI